MASPGFDVTTTVVESRSLDECRELLDEHPTALAVIELSRGNIEAVCSLLASIERRWPRAVVVLVTDAELRDETELLLREHGAQHVMSSRYDLTGAIDIARRHFRRATTAFMPASA